MPLFTIGLLLSIYKKDNVFLFITDRDKVGLWYLWSLFNLYIIAVLGYWVLSLFRKHILIDLLFWLCIYILLRVLNYVLDDEISSVISLERTFSISAFFGLGCIVSKYNLQQYFVNKRIYEVMIIALVVDYFLFTTYNYFNTYTLKFIFVSLPAVYVIVSIFKEYSYESCFYKTLATMGRYSLEIYTFHYFFLGTFTFPTFSVLTTQNGLLIINSICAIFLGFIFCVLSIIISKFVKTSNVFSFLMFGILRK